MSHHAGGHVPPYISSCTPNAIYEGGNTTITIEGNRFSPTMKVDVPAGLGTLVSKTISYPTANTCRVVLVINVVEPTSTPTDYTITLSNGGEFSSDSVATIKHVTFLPTFLIKGSHDYWYNPDSLSSTYSDGNKVSSFPPSGGSMTLTQSTTNLQHEYIHNHTWSAGKVASGVGLDAGSPSTTLRYYDNVVPLSSSSGNIEGLTIAFIVKSMNSTAWNSHWPVYFAIGNHHSSDKVYIRYRIGYGWQATGISTTANGDFDNQNTIRTVFYTISNSTNARLVSPGAGIDSTGTISAIPIPTAAGWSYGSWQTPVLYGEALILNYAISDQERADLQAYWADKYGA